jgi:hypothetical protein
MRAFGLIGLVITLAIMGFLLKKRMTKAPAVNAKAAPQLDENLPAALQTGRADHKTLMQLKNQIEQTTKKQMDDRARKAMKASGSGPGVED